MEPWVDDLADDLESLSFNSTASSTTSSATLTTASSSSAHGSFAAKPHAPPSDPRLHSIQRLSDLRFLRRLGSGDIGAVYLAEIRSSSPSDPSAPSCRFAAKVMDKEELASRSKEGRAKTEREILEVLDHPFLPTLYASVDSNKWICLLTEFCPGGDLHVLRQRQANKRFDDAAVRFFASEVVVAIEYLHMMGIIYRDLKPENVLVRSDGHIMLTDFDLSLKCDSSTSTAHIISPSDHHKPSTPTAQPKHSSTSSSSSSSSCILPNCIVPSVSCFHPKRKRKKKLHPKLRHGPEFVTTGPVDVRSMSFVGTHEYLAPEIVSGEGHGAGVDWWTLGIFMFEMFYGSTPFRGPDHELTLANIVARALEFPREPPVGAAAKELMSQLLAKDPERRLGAATGASGVKQHPFFHGVNWALLRCQKPPYVPKASEDLVGVGDGCPETTAVEYY